VDISFLGGMPLLSPTFAVRGPRAYLAANPTALSAVIDQAENPQSSLLDNPDYRATRAKFPEKVVAVTFEDTRQIVAQLYTTIYALRPVLQGRPDAPVDLDLLPPVSNIQDKLFGGVGVVTADGNELVLQQYSAFGVNFNSFGGGGTPIMAALMLPALNQARERARSANCQANLKQIGIACNQYADNHGGQFPESVDVLVSSQLLSSNTAHCPSAPAAGGLSYTYCRGYTPKNIYRILAFDADGNHRNGGRNVLFCDGHVEWMTDVKFHALLQKQM
jgi:prepilin-type processing-associated H-X9-DG protein